jgi:hypothetical protein
MHVDERGISRSPGMGTGGFYDFYDGIEWAGHQDRVIITHFVVSEKYVLFRDGHAQPIFLFGNLIVSLRIRFNIEGKGVTADNLRCRYSSCQRG